MELLRSKQYHQCSLCDFQCTAKHQLECHIRQHTLEKPFICDQCKKEFSQKSTLKIHVLHVHKGERRFPCHHPGCEYAAKWASDLRDHDIYKHKNERNFLCPVLNCGYRAKTRNNMRQHSLTHQQYRRFICDFEGCSYKTIRKESLEQHKAVVHRGHPCRSGYKPFACSICDFRTTRKSSLRRHQVTHLKEKSVKCDLSGCSYSCTSKRVLKIHNLYHHTKKTLKCDFHGCSFDTAIPVKMKLHTKKAHSKCLYCNFQALNPKILRAHMDRHGIRIPCPTKGCTFQARNSTSLLAYVQRHEENMVCPVDRCDFVGLRNSSWERHMKLHDSTERPFPCPLCPKHYVSKGSLYRHLKTHTKEKLYKCSACDYESIDKTRMTEHVQAIHSPDLPNFVFDAKAIGKHCKAGRHDDSNSNR